MARTRLERMIGRLDREEGFTLVELLVVIQILSILIIITTSVFFGARNRAMDSAAQQAVARALATGRILFTDHATYTDATPLALGDSEGSLSFKDEVTPSTEPKEVSRDVPSLPPIPDGYVFVAASYSNTGTCFFIKDVVSSGIEYGKLLVESSTDCYASNTGAITWARAWSA